MRDSYGRLSRRSVIGALAALAVGGLSAGCVEDPPQPPTAPPEPTGERTADNPFGVDKAAALTAVVFSRTPGFSYAEQQVGLYNTWAGGTPAQLTSTSTVAADVGPALSSGRSPDVVDNTTLAGDPISGIPAAAIPTAELLANGQLKDLSVWLDAPTIDDPNTLIRDQLLPGTEALGSVDGSMYVLNYAFHLWGWWYSRTLFEENGWAPARTWSDFLSLCDDIKATGLAPIIHPGQNAEQLGVMLQTAAIKSGGNQVAVDMDMLTPTSWTNDHVLLAAEQVQELYDQGFLSAGSEDLGISASRAEWVRGRAAMLPSGSWVEADLGTTVPLTFEMNVMPHPSSPADSLPVETIFAGTGAGYVIPQVAANKPGAMEYLRIMISQAATEAFTTRTQTLAAVKGSWDNLTDPAPGLASTAQTARAAGDNIVNVFSTTVPWYPELRQGLTVEMARLTTGRSQASEFCGTMQDRADALRADTTVRKFQRVV